MKKQAVDTPQIIEPACTHPQTSVTVLKDSKDIHGKVHAFRVYCYGCMAFIPEEDNAAKAAISQYLKDKR